MYFKIKPSVIIHKLQGCDEIQTSQTSTQSPSTNSTESACELPMFKGDYYCDDGMDNCDLIKNNN